MFQEIQIYFAWNLRLKGIDSASEVAQPIWPDLTWSRPTRLYCLADFMLFNLESHTKHNKKSLKHAPSPCAISSKILSVVTPNLKWKKLLNNSSWDFEHVLDTMDDYWVGLDENFCPESTPTRWCCYHFSKEWLKSKFEATLSIKKPFVTKVLWSKFF